LSTEAAVTQHAHRVQSAVVGLLLQRSITLLPRETLDWPLALLSMDWHVYLFLSGPVLAQLPRQLEMGTTAASTAPTDCHAHWSRLWLAAAELGAELFVSAPDWERWGLQQDELAGSLTILTPVQMRARKAVCRHLLSV
jgi:hypothetical protein